MKEYRMSDNQDVEKLLSSWYELANKTPPTFNEWLPKQNMIVYRKNKWWHKFIPNFLIRFFIEPVKIIEVFPINVYETIVNDKSVVSFNCEFNYEEIKGV